jgi:hypothetical protein
LRASASGDTRQVAAGTVAQVAGSRAGGSRVLVTTEVGCRSRQEASFPAGSTANPLLARPEWRWEGTHHPDKAGPGRSRTRCSGCERLAEHSPAGATYLAARRGRADGRHPGAKAACTLTGACSGRSWSGGFRGGAPSGAARRAASRVEGSARGQRTTRDVRPGGDRSGSLSASAEGRRQERKLDVAPVGREGSYRGPKAALSTGGIQRREALPRRGKPTEHGGATPCPKGPSVEVHNG